MMLVMDDQKTRIQNWLCSLPQWMGGAKLIEDRRSVGVRRVARDTQMKWRRGKEAKYNEWKTETEESGPHRSGRDGSCSVGRE